MTGAVSDLGSVAWAQGHPRLTLVPADPNQIEGSEPDLDITGFERHLGLTGPNRWPVNMVRLLQVETRKRCDRVS
jgi:hypothetical protein